MVHEHDLIVHGALTDAQFMGRFVSTLRSVPETVGSVATFCILPFQSLFVYESYARLKELDNGLASELQLSREAAVAIARSRHSLKLFEDTKRNIEGQLDYFADILIPAHHERFIGTKLSLRRLLGNDLGIYYYDGSPVSSTHCATFTLGLEPDTLLSRGSQGELRRISEEYGRYFAAWGAVLSDDATSFLTAMVPTLLGDKDVRAEHEYRNHFNGPKTPALNSLLFVFQCMLNTADALLPLDEQPESRSTLLKIKYLSIYQVLRSLKALLQTRRCDLDSRSVEYARSMLNTSSARILLARPRRPFRNTLMHYRPDGGVDLSRLSLDVPLYGLVELFFDLEAASLEQLLSELIAHSSSVMNEWSEARRRHRR